MYLHGFLAHETNIHCSIFTKNMSTIYFIIQCVLHEELIQVGKIVSMSIIDLELC